MTSGVPQLQFHRMGDSRSHVHRSTPPTQNLVLECKPHNSMRM